MPILTYCNLSEKPVKTFTTEIEAIDPIDGVLKTWSGQNIEAGSIDEAIDFCQNNGLGYLKITDELVAEIPFHISEHVGYLSREN